MAYKAQILLGTISKLHGYEGAVTVRLEKAIIECIPEPESVFLEIEGKPVPFFIADLEYPGSDILWLKFEGYESIQKVQEFTGCRVFLTTGEIEILPAEHFGNLKGYRIFSLENRSIGRVIEIIENPGQILLNINAGRGREILIPLHENLIISTDNKKKIIKMDLPDGLIDLNS
jgi:16S rRNA processing protein RimM